MTSIYFISLRCNDATVICKDDYGEIISMLQFIDSIQVLKSIRCIDITATDSFDGLS